MVNIRRQYNTSVQVHPKRMEVTTKWRHIHNQLVAQQSHRCFPLGNQNEIYCAHYAHVRSLKMRRMFFFFGIEIVTHVYCCWGDKRWSVNCTGYGGESVVVVGDKERERERHWLIPPSNQPLHWWCCWRSVYVYHRSTHRLHCQSMSNSGPF